MFTRTVTLKTKKSFKYYVCSKCNSQISDIALMKSIDEEFSLILRQEQFKKDIKGMEKSCSDTAKLIKNLPLSFFLYGVDKNYVEKLIQEKTEDKDIMESNINRLQAGLQNIRFQDLSYSQTRDFLSRNVDVIDVNLSTKFVKVQYKDEENIVN